MMKYEMKFEIENKLK